MPIDLGQRIKQQPATRADLARQFLARVDRLAPRLKDVSLAVEVQMLKRDLARSHPILSARPENSNFLAVVTLVEAALASQTWKGYTPVVLEALRQAFSAGLHEGECTKARAPSCSWCERLGDTIIALQVERGVSVVTADRTFVPLGELLARPVVLLPSLAERKRRK